VRDGWHMRNVCQGEPACSLGKKERQSGGERGPHAPPPGAEQAPAIVELAHCSVEGLQAMEMLPVVPLRRTHTHTARLNRRHISSETVGQFAAGRAAFFLHAPPRANQPRHSLSACACADAFARDGLHAVGIPGSAPNDVEDDGQGSKAHCARQQQTADGGLFVVVAAAERPVRARTPPYLLNSEHSCTHAQRLL
jgi:hypothetical protein